MEKKVNLLLLKAKIYQIRIQDAKKRQNGNAVKVSINAANTSKTKKKQREVRAG